MRRLAILLVWMFCAVHESRAQYNCSIQQYGNISGSTINVSSGSGWQGPVYPGAALDAAIGQWNNSCGPSGAGVEYPTFQSGTGSGYPVTVNYHDEPGPACGQTSTIIYQNTPVGSTIDLWSSFAGQSCEPISDSLAHEFGHVLGLADVTYSQYCYGSIMGGRAPGGTRSITSSDCAAVDLGWYTPTEQYRDEQRADDQARLQECESRCSSHCEMAYGGSYYCPSEGQSPIIFDLDDNGFNLTDADHGVNFDLNADHQRERIAWTSSAGSDAWLCRDRNGDGVIGDGRELFGNFTPLANGQKAPNGFVALAEFDTPALGGNGDGQLDSRDRLWTTLLLWIDANHDGLSQPSELMTLAEAGVQSIDLQYIRSNYTDDNGNIFRFRSKALVRSPNGKLHNAKIYDVFLSTSVTGSSGVP